MSSHNQAERASIQRLRWIARIWGGLVFVVALFIFAGSVWSWITTGTGDPYAVADYPPIENLPPILMFVGAVGSAIAWRWEGLGGAVTTLSQLAALPVLLIHWPIAEGFARYLVAPYGVWVAVAVPGVLFLACWYRSRELRPSATGP